MTWRWPAACLLLLLPGWASRAETEDPASTAAGVRGEAVAAPGHLAATGEPPRYIVIRHTPGLQWLADQSFRTQPGIRDHMKHYEALADEGRLVLGGPFLDDSGGLMVVSGGLDEVTGFAFEDPAVENGVLGVKISEWSVLRSSDDPLASRGFRPEIRSVILHGHSDADSMYSAPALGGHEAAVDRAAGVVDGVALSGPFTDGSGGLVVAAPGLLAAEWGNRAVEILALTPGVHHAEVHEWLIVFKHEPDSR